MFFIEKLTEEVLLIEESIVNSDVDRFVGYLGRLRTIDYGHLEREHRDKIK